MIRSSRYFDARRLLAMESLDSREVLSAVILDGIGAAACIPVEASLEGTLVSSQGADSAEGEGETVELSVSPVTLVKQGLEGVATLSLQSGASELRAIDLAFEDGARLLDDIEVELGALTSDWTLETRLDESNDVVYISAFHPSPPAADAGELLKLRLKGEEGKSGQLTLGVSGTLNEGGIPFEVSGGVVDVLPVGLSIPSDLRAPIGASVDVPVEIEDGEGVLGADLVIQYDTGLIDLTDADVKLGAAAAGWSLVANVNDEQGLIRASLFGTEPLPTADGQLLNITVHSTGLLGISPLEFHPDTRINENLFATKLEDGQVEFSGWQNPRNPLDVDDDGNVAPADALIVINRLNSGNRELPLPPAKPPPFYDVDADEIVAPADALLIINFLNQV